jgi:hypothetical protein
VRQSHLSEQFIGVALHAGVTASYSPIVPKYPVSTTSRAGQLRSTS